MKHMKQRTFINRFYTCQCHQMWILFTSTTFLWRLLKIPNIHLCIFPGLSSVWVKSQALLRVWHPDTGGAWSVWGHRGVSSKGGGTQIHLPQSSGLQGRQDDKLKHVFQFAKATTHPGEYFHRMDLVSIPIGIHFYNIVLRRKHVFSFFDIFFEKCLFLAFEKWIFDLDVDPYQDCQW